jgi:hypothetical protein
MVTIQKSQGKIRWLHSIRTLTRTKGLAMKCALNLKTIIRGLSSNGTENPAKGQGRGVAVGKSAQKLDF